MQGRIDTFFGRPTAEKGTEKEKEKEEAFIKPGTKRKVSDLLLIN